jgi:mannose/cellobiose epimerase-like protein (N-acyl-D-glucosamine 2-epimerase family)
VTFPVDFRSRRFLLDHARRILAFYDPRAVDPAGGFFHCYMNDGRVFDPATRTLVASCRFIVNYAKAAQHFGQPAYLDKARHGLTYLRSRHRQPETGGYAWRIVGGEVADDTNHCYGLAFVLLAYACAFAAGIAEAEEWLYEAAELMERRFWDQRYGLYASEATADWQLLPYRGQNDNMHACEALIAAYEATGESPFLARAAAVAENIVIRQAALTGGQVWEHFTPDWTPDTDYNRNERSNNIRPWGVQTGHQTEWAKLLMILDRHDRQDWRLPRACELFDSALARGWDGEFGGLIYGYDLNGQSYDQDKYFWVHAESIAAAALLADRSGDEAYWRWYDTLWRYSDAHLVDHQYGAWYRILSRDNRRYDERKSYANKADYHTLGACFEAMNVIGD